jgi:hypothetical protein
MALTATACGVDTWAPSWRVSPDSSLAQRYAQRATLPSAKGGLLVPERVAGHRLIFWPASGLLKAEGHPAARGLAPVASLPDALVRLQRGMAAEGMPVPAGVRRFRRFRESEGFAGLRRLDLTVDLRASDRVEGRAVLRAVEAAARNSGLHAPTYGRRGKPGHTVYVAGETGVQSRFYDKGAESGQAAPYRWIRPEAQWRFRDLSAPLDTELCDPVWMREQFAKRWGPAFRGRIVVGDMSELGRELARAVREGRLEPGEARRIAGYLVMAPFGLDGVPERTARRLRTEAGKFGFHLVDGVLEPIEVDLGEVLAEAERPELWDSGLVGHVEPPDRQETAIRDRMRAQLDARRPPPRPR